MFSRESSRIASCWESSFCLFTGFSFSGEILVTVSDRFAKTDKSEKLLGELVVTGVSVPLYGEVLSAGTGDFLGAMVGTQNSADKLLLGMGLAGEVLWAGSGVFLSAVVGVLVGVVLCAGCGAFLAAIVGAQNSADTDTLLFVTGSLLNSVVDDFLGTDMGMFLGAGVGTFLVAGVGTFLGAAVGNFLGAGVGTFLGAGAGKFFGAGMDVIPSILNASMVVLPGPDMFAILFAKEGPLLIACMDVFLAANIGVLIVIGVGENLGSGIGEILGDCEAVEVVGSGESESLS